MNGCFLLRKVPLRITILIQLNHISSLVVSVLVSNVVDRGFDARSGQGKDYKIGICCFFVKRAAVIGSNRIYLLARNRNNVPEWAFLRPPTNWAITIFKKSN
jgi:hypothetical protein